MLVLDSLLDLYAFILQLLTTNLELHISHLTESFLHLKRFWSLSKTIHRFFAMPGFLVSKYYKPEAGVGNNLQIAAIIFGFILGFGLLTCVKAAIRTKTAWHRARRAKIMIVMVWGEMVVSLVFGLLGWLHINDIVGPRHDDL